MGSVVGILGSEFLDVNVTEILYTRYCAQWSAWVKSSRIQIAPLSLTDTPFILVED